MPLFSPPLKPLSPFASMRADHAGFRVADPEEALAWYRDTLDFRLVARSEAAGLTFTMVAPANDDAFRLELVSGPGAVERPGAHDLAGSLGLDGWNHVCLRVDGVDDAVAELERRAVRILLEPTDAPELRARVAFFADPWGNVIELLQPRLG